jgi:hypothetical protein
MLLLATASVMVTAACGGVGAVTKPSRSTATSGIVGVTEVDAGCPPAAHHRQCTVHPIPAHLIVMLPNPSHQIAQLDSYANGTFRIPLPPGTYELRSTNLSGRPLPSAPPLTVQVRENTFTAITVRFDSGVR